MTYAGYMNMDTSSKYVSDVSDRLSFQSYPDANNNTSKEKYSLRPRSLRSKGSDPEEDEPQAKRPRGAAKQKPAPLSKYRRKTANARERSRMREINAAFETLRRCVPVHAPAPAPPPNNNNSEKLTKITTLRLAMKYIEALSSALNTDASTSTTESVNTDLQHFFSECSDLDCLLLESDGESLPLSDHSLTEPCLTPVNLNMNFENFGDHSLSPTFTDPELSPFDSLFPDFS